MRVREQRVFASFVNCFVKAWVKGATCTWCSWPIREQLASHTLVAVHVSMCTYVCCSLYMYTHECTCTCTYVCMYVYLQRTYVHCRYVVTRLRGYVQVCSLKLWVATWHEGANVFVNECSQRQTYSRRLCDAHFAHYSWSLMTILLPFLTNTVPKLEKVNGFFFHFCWNHKI